MKKRYIILSLLIIITNILIPLRTYALSGLNTDAKWRNPRLNSMLWLGNRGERENNNYRIFLKINDVKGDSQVRTHDNEIDVISYSFESNPSDNSKPYAIKVVKNIDSSSPLLLEKMIKSGKSPDAQISVYQGDDVNKEIYQIKLKNMSIITYGQFVDSSNGAYEEICLYYDTIQFKYDLYDDSGKAYPVITRNNLKLK